MQRDHAFHKRQNLIVEELQHKHLSATEGGGFSATRRSQGILRGMAECGMSGQQNCGESCLNVSLGVAETRMKVRVESSSGFRADERPIRFQLNGNDYFVEELLDQWHGAHDAYFRVRADDDNFYILRPEVCAPEGRWHLESFRQDQSKTCCGSGHRREFR